MSSVEVEEFEEVEGHGGPLLEERSEAVLGREPSWASQLAIGQPEWLRRLDAGTTRQDFGHHGLAVGDVNGDGLEDVYICQPAGLPNRLLLHQPDGSVRDTAASAGVDWLEPTQAAILADFDNDGDDDLALAIERDVLIQANDGRGRFAPPSVLLRGRNGIALAVADYDGDGDLDLYLSSYYPETIVPGRLAEPAPYHDANNGGQNALLRNDTRQPGTWEFADVTDATGLGEDNRRWSFGAAWEDFDDDGDQDLAVANDFGRMNFFRNDAGTFRDVASSIGLDASAFGMSVSWGDYDRDGRFDLYLAGMFSSAGSRIVPQARFRASEGGRRRDQFLLMARGNSMFRNGDGRFEDVSVQTGTTMGRWAWAAPLADLNNDGWEDILVANGWLTNSLPNDL